MTAIEVRNARKTFKAGKRTVVAVDDVSLSVPEGGVMGIVGESGCASPRSRASSSGCCRRTPATS